MGICTINAGTDTQIADLAELTIYSDLGKRIFAICDKQTEEKKALIKAKVDALFIMTKRALK